MKRMSCLALALVMAVCCLAAPAAAKNPVREGRQGFTNPEEEAQAPAPTINARIQKKNLETVTTRGGAVYALSEQTMIVGLDGQQLSIREMPVPCRVKLMYTTEKRRRLALRIDITAVSPDATTHWTSSVPD